jgi:GT2 family glycosyltransferase
VRKTLSIIILNYNTRQLTLDCLRSIFEDKTIPSYEIILIDNASTDDSVRQFNQLKWKNLVLILNKENVGFAKAVNQGIKTANGKYILLLNSDTKVKKGAIKKLVEFAKKNKDAGVVVPRLLNADESIQPSCFNLPSVSRAFNQYILGRKGILDKFYPEVSTPVVVESAVGAAFLITPEAINKVGLFDERYFMYFEDLDYCRRVNKNGLKVYYLPNSQIIHLHGQSGRRLAPKKDQWKRLIPSSKIYHGTLRHYILNFIIRFSRITKSNFGNVFKKYIPILIVFLSSFLASRNLFLPGYFPMHDDIQAFRLLEMDKCIKDFQIPCRWVPDMGYGYGYPQFNYYAPLPYYIMEFFHLLGFGFLDSTKIGFALSIFVSAFGMYLLAKSVFGSWGGVVASVFYVFAPYRAVNIFVRGAMGEAWGMAFLPFAFWSAWEIIFKKNKLSYLWLALSVFGIFSSHNVTALIFTIFFPLWIIFILLFQKRNIFHNIFKVFWPSLWGFMMSSFFTFPAFFEKKYVHIETMLMGYFNYLAHFVGLKQLLFSTKFGYGASVWGPDDDLLLSVGFLHWFIPLLVFLIFIFWRNENIKKHRLEIILFFIFGLISLFLIHPRSVFIWKIFPILDYLQFPWRFLLSASFFFSFVTGGLALIFSKITKLKILVLLFILPLVVGFNINYFKPEKILNITDEEKFSGSAWEKQLTISIFDYLPKSAKLPPAEKAPNEPFFNLGEGLVLDGKKGTNWQIWQIQVKSDNSEVVFPVYDYPKWKILSNGKEISYFKSTDLGLVTINLDKGIYEIRLKLEDTLIRKVSNYLTLISFSMILVFLFSKKYNKVKL